ncbi:MAG TPA: hypothetical protein VHY36_02695 [Steroidobacteraceae bacterium]|nr:hypothetical protein [Steroidobacteraceae bacterium]
MKSTSSILCIAAACAASLLGLGRAAAQDAAASQLDQLSSFLGHGTCAGNFMIQSGHPTSGRFHGEKALGDRWVVIRYDEETSSSNSRPYHVTQYFSYDAKAGHFVDVLLDNSGGSYSAGSSSGWQGDVITFENTDFTSGSHSMFRDVFTRRGVNVISHAGYQRDKSGKWVKSDEEICKKM